MKERDYSLKTLQQLFATVSVSYLFPRFPCILLTKNIETCGRFLHRRLEIHTIPYPWWKLSAEYCWYRNLASCLTLGRCTMGWNKCATGVVSQNSFISSVIQIDQYFSPGWLNQPVDKNCFLSLVTFIFPVQFHTFCSSARFVQDDEEEDGPHLSLEWPCCCCWWWWWWWWFAEGCFLESCYLALSLPGSWSWSTARGWKENRVIKHVTTEPGRAAASRSELAQKDSKSEK